jgi:CheY-like chemotaxis protein
VIFKSGASSPEKLLSDTALFLHRLEEKLPEKARELLRSQREESESVAGKKVLIVDDDVRNIFALTSVLESHGIDAVYAENGKDAIVALERNPDVDVVLMDVMMPEMDGYQTMRAIRSDPSHKALPIIAITAKALKEDREKCIQAGASDYLPKPVENEKLLELIRLWARA